MCIYIYIHVYMGTHGLSGGFHVAISPPTWEGTYAPKYTVHGANSSVSQRNNGDSKAKIRLSKPPLDCIAVMMCMVLCSSKSPSFGPFMMVFAQ